jgi:formimidoylglutamate deiminase
VGIRIVLLRTVYLRGDFDTEPGEHQRRFCDGSLEEASTRIDALQRAVAGWDDGRVSVGVAAHSVRAMSKESIVSLKALHGNLPWHIHVSEQRREVESCKEVYGAGPVELLARNGALDGLTTLVHATHLEPGEAERIAEFDATVCVCPSTEADLGDGLINATALAKLGVRMALGTDGQTLSSVLQEARRLEMHERLRRETRNALALEEGASPVDRIFAGASAHGALALNVSAGELAEGLWADCVSYDLNDPHLVGLDDDSLLGTLLFSGDSRALSDVMVGGEWVVRDGVHPLSEKTCGEFADLTRVLF